MSSHTRSHTRTDYNRTSNRNHSCIRFQQHLQPPHILCKCLHLLFTRLSNNTGSNNPPLTSSQYFPSRIEFSSCTICPPSLLRLRFLSIWRCQVEGLDLCFTCDVHRGRCVACVANLLPKPLANLRVQIPTTVGAFHLSGNMWAVREDAHCRSPSRLSLASPSAWKTSCLHSKRVMAREREL